MRRKPMKRYRRVRIRPKQFGQTDPEKEAANKAILFSAVFALIVWASGFKGLLR